MSEVERIEAMLKGLREVAESAQAACERADQDAEDQRRYVEELRQQVEVEQAALSRLRGAAEYMLSARHAARTAIKDMEKILEEARKAEAPGVPVEEPVSNVHPIRPVEIEAKTTATVGIGAAVKRAKAKKPRKKKLTPEQEKKQKLKSTHVTGVLGFAGAEKPDHL